MSESRGEILHQVAYAQGKMLNNSTWQKMGICPRGITPSDIDLQFDNEVLNRMLLGEVSRKSAWEQLSNGQHRSYKSHVRIGQGRTAAVLLTHSVPPEVGREIDTVKDIESCVFMWWYNSDFVYAPLAAKLWASFVECWYRDPDEVLFSVFNMVPRERLCTKHGFHEHWQFNATSAPWPYWECSLCQPREVS